MFYARSAWALMGAGALAMLMAVPASAQRNRDRITLPADTVIRVELDQNVSSNSAREGDRVTARLDEDDQSDLPRGTRFEGTITQARRHTDDRPAIIDMEFRRVTMPNGSTEMISADLASLDEGDVRSDADGRLRSRRSGDDFDWKWVGVGAGGGAILGGIFGDNWLRGGLLGGLGGAVYSYLNRDKDNDFNEIDLDRGTEFGLRLTRDLTFQTQPSYRFVDRDRFYRDRTTDQYRSSYRMADTSVYVDGRAVNFGELRPMRINGQAYFPLRPIAEAANWRLRHYPGSDDFVLTTSSGRTRGSSDSETIRQDRTDYTLSAAPMTVGGEIYVPMEYFSRASGASVGWNSRRHRLDISSSGSLTTFNR